MTKLISSMLKNVRKRYLALTCLLISLSSPVTLFSAILDVDLGAGWRNDSLNWSIAGFNNHPDVLSELQWENVHSYVIGGFATFELLGFHARAYADYGKIYSGSNQDSDYWGSHRTFEYQRSIASADNGEVFDLSIGFGKLYSFLGGFLSFSPTAGYSLHEQHLHMNNGKIVVNKVTDFLGPISGLHSSYKARWKGAFMGVDAAICLSRLLTVSGTYERHWPSFFGTGNWNLRDDFYDDFKHYAHGKGTVVALNGKLNITPLFGFSLCGCYQTWKTDEGIDKTFINADVFDTIGNIIGYTPIEAETQLNGVNWHAFSIILSLNWCL